ncbi:hypothetical protein QR680_018767 [Steinernema hermaphroditum]|uniref:Uncharacterized protein n=1 Tax=Steinernema hermaphroditum TaxID=289476 RepID=A0AA39HIY7_9BILA|nr:hypothetical protein QR680_018767 [Steinernema hermaphroditum]
MFRPQPPARPEKTRSGAAEEPKQLDAGAEQVAEDTTAGEESTAANERRESETESKPSFASLLGYGSLCKADNEEDAEGADAQNGEEGVNRFLIQCFYFTNRSTYFRQ